MTSTYSPRKILVTGADGFIGSHLTEALVKSGHRVKALVFYNSFNTWGWLDQAPKEVLKDLEVFAADIRDAGAVRTAMKDCDVVFNLAALIAIPFSYIAPEAYIDTNIKGALNVLQAAREFDFKKVIQVSTSEVYGTAQFVPITEEHPLNGQSPYAATKIGADQLALSFQKSFGLPVTVIRPFNTFGPRQSARAVIPTIISQIQNGASKIKLGSLRPTRDFNYVKDIVRGFMLAGTSDAGVGETIQLGTNFEISVGDTALLIAEIMNRKIEFVCESERMRPKDSEVERLWADPKKANQLLGWMPEYAGHEGLKKGLKETIEWFSVKENLARYKHDIYNV